MSKCTKCESEAHRGMLVCAKCFGYITRGCPTLRRRSDGNYLYFYGSPGDPENEILCPI